MALLKTENISVSYDGTKIIEDINIELNDGELVCLLGVSGSGKSTLFNAISGLLTPDSGRILFKERILPALPVCSAICCRRIYSFHTRQ